MKIAYLEAGPLCSMTALQGAADSARAAVIAEAGEKFKALNQLAIEQERAKAAAEKAQARMRWPLSARGAVVLEQERTDLRERLSSMPKPEYNVMSRSQANTESLLMDT